MESKKAAYGPMILRIFLGILFFVAGLGKIMNPPSVVDMLSGLGFPVPTFFAWILLLSELVFGLALIFGWKVRYSVWPLVIVLVVALLVVYLPDLDFQNQGNIMSILWHLVGLAGLVSLAFTGAGAAAVSRD